MLITLLKPPLLNTTFAEPVLTAFNICVPADWGQIDTACSELSFWHSDPGDLTKNSVAEIAGNSDISLKNDPFETHADPLDRNDISQV